MRSPHFLPLFAGGICFWIFLHLLACRSLLSSSPAPHSSLADLGSNDLILPFLHLFDGAKLSSASASASASITHSVALHPDPSIQLPRGGKFYRLGDIHRQRRDVASDRSLRIIQRPRSPSLYDPTTSPIICDILWSDFRGAFDQEIWGSSGIPSSSSSSSLFMDIPWREPHEPLFLIVYEGEGGNRSDHEVIYVEGAQITYNNSTSAMMDAIDQPRRELFYRKRKGTGGKVTLCTQITPERLGYLAHIVRAWGGPASVVVYVGHKGRQVEELAGIDAFWDVLSNDLQANLDLHIVYDDHKPWYSTTQAPNQNPYPVNLLRQIAVDCVQTEWLYVTEGDMLTVSNAHQIILDSWQGMMEAYNKHNGAGFVVPLYKAETRMDEEVVRAFPRNRQDMTTRKISGEYQRSGEVFGNQKLTDFEGWEGLPDGSTNFLPYHKSGTEAICNPPGGAHEQEPYYLVKKEDCAPYNVLYAGMWFDKTTQIIDACNCGLTFLLHPELFTVIFDEPESSTKTSGWTNNRADDRQKMVFLTGPAYSQEYQKARLAIDGGPGMCSRVANVPVGEAQPYLPWVPLWFVREMGNQTNGMFRTSQTFEVKDNRVNPSPFTLTHGNLKLSK